MTLYLFMAEYACPVWRKSVHTKKMDTGTNETHQIKTRCLKPIKKENL